MESQEAGFILFKKKKKKEQRGEKPSGMAGVEG